MSGSSSHTHHAEAHEHAHAMMDPQIVSTERGICAIKRSFYWLLATAFLQSLVVLISGSVALLADTLHNFADALTALPLWLAFVLARRRPTKRFTYGYGRFEDLAGVIIVVMIFLSGGLVAHESIQGLSEPRIVQYLPAVLGAAIIGFLGNEAVARLRIKIGKEIGSAVLVADGYHARVDALTSLMVAFSVGGLWLGFPLADPVVGAVIALAILKIGWDSGKMVFLRLLDGVDPGVVNDVRLAAHSTPGVSDVSEVRVRWVGHRLLAELNVAVKPELSIEQAHDIATNVRHSLLHELKYLTNATIHLDPLTASGEDHHRIENHTHDELPSHSH